MPLHPLLVAAYPVVFLFGHNIDQQVSLTPLWAPLAIALAGALLVLTVFGLFWRDAPRAALATTLLAVLFFSYGHLQDAIGAALPSPWPLLAVWSVLALGAVIVARRGGGWIGPATGFLNVAAAVAIGISAVGIGAHTVRAYAPVETLGLGRASPAQSPPDIYYIVPDRYASARMLERHYAFDNSAFIDALMERGFHVAPLSHANYPRSGPSLLSTLSMEYLDGETLQEEQSRPNDESPVNRRLAGSLAVPSFLREAGYRYIHLGNVWEPTSTNADADVVLTSTDGNEFAAMLARTTVLAAFLAAPQDPENPWDDGFVRAHTLNALERLEETADGASPRFVFAHLLLPHAPYVFDADGSLPSAEDRERRGERGSYLEQLQYANARLLALIDRLQRQARPVVIIIQADEGPWPDRLREIGPAFDWTTASDAELEHKFGILSAFHLPGTDIAETGLHPGITPVNTFRVVFNAYFGTDLPLLPDRVFAHTAYRDFLDFFEITDRLAR